MDTIVMISIYGAYYDAVILMESEISNKENQ